MPNQRDFSAERRRFLVIAARYGFAVAVLAATGGFLWDDAAIAQTDADEAKKAAAAKVTMVFATEYKIEDYVKLPIMQGQFKTNLENASKNEIYVKLHPAGQLGIGAALAQKLQGGTVQGAAVSLSNFSPYTAIVDVINIPFWLQTNQQFANLVTSQAWNGEITPKVTEKGYQPMFYFTMDTRTVSTRKGHKPVKTPADMQGMKMRVPPSQLLQQFYRLAGANPTVVAWGETATALKQGVADGLDPAIAPLVTFGFADILGHITYVRSVPDAQMFAANAGWYKSLSDTQKKAFDDASAKTQAESFAQIESCRTSAIKTMADAGAPFYVPNEAEAKQWVEACGDARKEWDEFKVKLCGSIDNFDKLKKAANTKGALTVSDYKG
jgi:TRAP-type C4-dicarboxylate transport system substrate-binding protein